MSDQDWQAGLSKSLGVFLNGNAIPTLDEHGRRVTDDSFYLMFNAHADAVEFVLPEAAWGEHWTVTLDTNELPDHLDIDGQPRTLAAGEHLHVQAWSLVVLRRLTIPRDPASRIRVIRVVRGERRSASSAQSVASVDPRHPRSPWRASIRVIRAVRGERRSASSAWSVASVDPRHPRGPWRA